MRTINWRKRATALLTLAAFAAAIHPAVSYADADCTSLCDEYKNSIVGGSSKFDASKHGSNNDGDQSTTTGGTPLATADNDGNTGKGGGGIQMNKAYAYSNCPPPDGTQTGAGAGTGSNFAGQSGSSSGQASAAGDQTNQPIDLSYRSVPDDAAGKKSDFDICFVKLQARWEVLAQHCAAIALIGTAQTEELVTAIIYTVASALCAIGCYYPAATLACTIGSFLAMGSDIVGMAIIDGEANQYKPDDWGLSIGSSVGAAAGTVVSAAGMIAGGGVKAASKASACWAMGFTMAGMVAKWVAYGLSFNNIAQECKNITSLDSNFAYVSTDTNTVTPPPDTTVVKTNTRAPGSGNSTVGAVGGGGGNGSKVDSFISGQFGGSKPFPPGNYAAATAGDIFGTVLGGITDLPSAPSQLQAAGIDPSKLAKAVASGQTLGQAMANSGADLPGLSEVGQSMDKLQKDLQDGKIKFLDSTGKPYAGTGGKGAPVAAKPAAANPFASLGMKGPAGDTPKDATFEKAKRDLATTEEGTDIWHEGFGGTIFQIVSHKLDKSHERVDQLEWDTPLNRALVGLPARKTANGGK